jgi:hypothetical protein
MGLGKMAEVSSLSYASLATTARNFLRPETLPDIQSGWLRQSEHVEK